MKKRTRSKSSDTKGIIQSIESASKLPPSGKIMHTPIEFDEPDNPVDSTPSHGVHRPISRSLSTGIPQFSSNGSSSSLKTLQKLKLEQTLSRQNSMERQISRDRSIFESLEDDLPPSACQSEDDES